MTNAFVRVGLLFGIAVRLPREEVVATADHSPSPERHAMLKQQRLKIFVVNFDALCVFYLFHYDYSFIFFHRFLITHTLHVYHNLLRTYTSTSHRFLFHNRMHVYIPWIGVFRFDFEPIRLCKKRRKSVQIADVRVSVCSHHYQYGSLSLLPVNYVRFIEFSALSKRDRYGQQFKLIEPVRHDNTIIVFHCSFETITEK